MSCRYPDSPSVFSDGPFVERPFPACRFARPGPPALDTSLIRPTPHVRLEISGSLTGARMRKIHSIAIALFACLLVAPAAWAQQKTIKDPGEYNAYMAGLNSAHPAQKAASMESFVVKYPNSVVKIDALEQATAAYQLASTQAGVEKAARR